MKLHQKGNLRWAKFFGGIHSIRVIGCHYEEFTNLLYIVHALYITQQIHTIVGSEFDKASPIAKSL